MPLDQTRTVHVKDLHFDVQEQELFAHFSSVGQVSSVKLHRDRQSRQSLGFAFVTYYHPMHASAAVAQLHYSNIRGQPIVVMWVGEHEALDPDANLFIRNLDITITNDQLYELFANYGRVISAKIMIDSNTQLSKGYGYVQFQFAGDAQTAMNQLQGYVFGQYQLQIDVFRPKGARYSGNANSGYGGDATYGNGYDGSTYDGAFEEAYQETDDQSSAYNSSYEGYESYYYGDNSSTGQEMMPQQSAASTNQLPPNLQPPNASASTTSSAASSYSGTSTVNIRVIDDGKGTLSDLSPSAPEWKPTLPTPSNTASTSTAPSSLKPNSPVFVPVGSSSNNNNNNNKLFVPSASAATGASSSSALSPPNSASATATGVTKKLSPNAPAWTGTLNNNSSTTSSSSTSSTNHSNTGNSAASNNASSMPIPATAPVGQRATSEGSSTTAGNPSTKTSPTIPILTNTTGVSLSSSPLLPTLVIPLATPSSMPSSLSNSVLSSSTTTTSTSTFLSSGLTSFASGFPASNSLLSFPLGLSSNATAQTSVMGSSLSTTSNSSSLLLPMLPSSFPFSDGNSSFVTLTGASASGIAPTSPAPSSSSMASSRVVLDSAAQNDMLSPVSSSPFPFHFSLTQTSTFPLTPSSPFPLSGATQNAQSSTSSLFYSSEENPDLKTRVQQLSTTLLTNSLDAQEGQQRLLMAALLLQSLSSGISLDTLGSTPKGHHFPATETRTTPGAGLFLSSSTHTTDSVLLEPELSSSSSSAISSTLPQTTAPFSPARQPAREESDSFLCLLDSLTPSSLPALENLLAHLGRVASRLESRRAALSLETTMQPPPSNVSLMHSDLENDHSAPHLSHSLLHDIPEGRWNA